MASTAADDKKRIEQRLAGLLARREHSAVELLRKLRQKGFAKDLVEEVISAFQQRGWQSDERYAQSVFRHRSESGYGPLKIRADLFAAGIDKALTEELMAAQSVDWAQKAAERCQRRFGTEPPNEPRERGRRQRHLLSRGFLPEHFPADI